MFFTKSFLNVLKQCCNKINFVERTLEINYFDAAVVGSGKETSGSDREGDDLEIPALNFAIIINILDLADHN